MDLATLCDTYVELKIATIDVIWLFSVLMEDLPTILWLPAPPPSTPVKVFVALM